MRPTDTWFIAPTRVSSSLITVAEFRGLAAWGPDFTVSGQVGADVEVEPQIIPSASAKL